MNYEKDILSKLSPAELRKLRDALQKTKVNVLLVGGTGVGKSSTIDALFQDHGLESKAKIGESTKPETMNISSHEMDNLIIWDTPGLGDSQENDQKHRKSITELLRREDEFGQPLIDLVFLVLDASSRDFSSASSLIKEVILPELAEDDHDRLLIGLNQADQAMKGYYWDKTENKPEERLAEHLEKLSQTVRERIKEDSGLDINPICYSAGCIIEQEVLSRPYNLQKLLSFIMDRLPKKKRAAIAGHINKDKENFQSNDGKEDYQEKVDKSILSSLVDYAKEISADMGNRIKEIVTDPDNIKWAAKAVITLIKTLQKSKN